MFTRVMLNALLNKTLIQKGSGWVMLNATDGDVYVHMGPLCILLIETTLTTPVLREGIERASQSVQSMLRVQFLPHISPLLDQRKSD